MTPEQKIAITKDIKEKSLPKNFLELDQTSQEIIFLLLKKDDEALEKHEYYHSANKDMFTFYMQNFFEFDLVYDPIETLMMIAMEPKKLKTILALPDTPVKL